MKKFGVGDRGLVFLSLLALVFLLASTPAKATTLQPLTGVSVSVEVFTLDGTPIVDDIGVTGTPIVCWEPVRVVLTVDVDETADLPIQVISFPGSPQPGKHPRSPWKGFVLSPKTLVGEYWVVWRCNAGSATVKIGAYTRILYNDGNSSINSGNTQVFDVTAQAAP